MIGRQSQNITDCVIRYCAIELKSRRDRPQQLFCHRLTSSMDCNSSSVFFNHKDFSLCSKRFRLVSEQRKTKERDCRFWPREKWNEVMDSRSSLFAPKPHGKACYAGYKDFHYSHFINTVCNCLSLGLGMYPGYQRFFSRGAGIFGAGRRPTHLQTETGNRARKVSGTEATSPAQGKGSSISCRMIY